MRKAEGYIATEMQSEASGSGGDGQYRVRDFWSGHRSFEIFRERFQEEFERFEAWLRSDGLIEKEQFLGAYYEKPEDGSDEDLVLS